MRNIEQSETIEWLVEFAQMDIDALKPSGHTKLAIDVKEYLFPELDFKRIKLRKRVLTKTRMERKDQYDCYPVSKIESIIDAYNDDPETYWDMVKTVQQLLYNILQQAILLGGKHTDDNNQTLANEAHAAIEVFAVVDGRLNCYNILATDSLHDYIKIKLYTLLDGFHVTAIKRCLGCGKIFFTPSLRERKFCHSRCQSRFHAAKRREAQRDSKQKSKGN